MCFNSSYLFNFIYCYSCLFLFFHFISLKDLQKLIFFYWSWNVNELVNMAQFDQKKRMLNMNFVLFLKSLHRAIFVFFIVLFTDHREHILWPIRNNIVSKRSQINQQISLIVITDNGTSFLWPQISSHMKQSWWRWGILILFIIGHRS